jgi:DNA-binding IclR family transcriptional regulator
MARGDEVKSVKRAVALLRCFSLDEPELGVTELGKRLGIHKSTVSRLLSTLEGEGLVNRNPETGRYRLGVGLISLAGLVMAHANLRQVAGPLLHELAEQTQETVDLAVRERNRAVNVEHIVLHRRRVLNIGWVGRSTPLHASSTGKVLLAYLPEEELDRLLVRPLRRFTEHTITDVSALRDELANVRQRGYATGLEELEIGLHALAVPVRDHSGRVIAAISVAGPSYRFTRQRMLGDVKEQATDCAMGVSQALGFRPASE